MSLNNSDPKENFNKFIEIEHPLSILKEENNPDLEKRIKRRDLFCSENAFLLENVLTKEECDFYINETEKKGFERLSEFFPKEYRNNDRLLTLNQQVANKLFQRILPHLRELGKKLKNKEYIIINKENQEKLRIF